MRLYVTFSSAMSLVALLSTASASGQWTWEVVDPGNPWVYAAFAIDSAGGAYMLLTGPADSYGDSKSDLSFRARIGANNWISPDLLTPLRVIRPAMAADAGGNVYVVYENSWANDTALIKYRRTGPTTWVRDGVPVLIAEDSMSGYYPRIAVGTDGSLHVAVTYPNPDGSRSARYSYNRNNVDWRTGWTPAVSIPGDEAEVTVDASNDGWIAAVGSGNASYARIHNGQTVRGPTTITDANETRGNLSLAVNGSTVYLGAREVTYAGAPWNAYVFSLGASGVSEGFAASSSTESVGPSYVIAAGDQVRFYWRASAPDARFAYYLACPGRTVERIRPGYDQGNCTMAVDAAGNVWAGMEDCGTDTCTPLFGLRANDNLDTTPPGDITAAVATTDQNTLSLSWTAPSDADLMGTKICIRTDRFATSPADATLLVSALNGPGPHRQYSLTDMPTGTTYFVSLFAWDSNGNLSLHAAHPSAYTFVRPDMDFDGDVDASDFGHLQVCLTGPFVRQIEPGCYDTLLDADLDTDADDVTIFLACFSGTGVLPPAGCDQ